MPNLGTARAQRFHAYVERLSTALGHRDRHGPLRAYVTGLCLPGERKSIEPMAARVDPRHVRARHQSMHHFVANAAWDDGAVLRAARETVLAALERHGPVAAWVVDDTGMPKKGRHSVGVARQYCGVLGKQDNCQVAVSLSWAHERASVPVAYRLYLPETWAQDRRRRRAAGVPDAIEFRTKWQIALEQVAQIADRGRAGRTGRRGCRLWRRHRLSRGADRAGDSVRRRHQHRDDRVGARPRAAAPAEVSRPRPTADTAPPDWAASPPQRTGPGSATAGAGLAHRDLARRHARRDAVALRGGPRPTRASRRLALDTPARRVAAHRMAAGGSCADQVLALHAATDGDLDRLGPLGDVALAHRAGLPRAQGRAGAGSLRRPGLARLPSSRLALHRGVRIPRRRAAHAFPP